MLHAHQYLAISRLTGSCLCFWMDDSLSRGSNIIWPIQCMSMSILHERNSRGGECDNDVFHRWGVLNLTEVRTFGYPTNGSRSRPSSRWLLNAEEVRWVGVCERQKKRQWLIWGYNSQSSTEDQTNDIQWLWIECSSSFSMDWNDEFLRGFSAAMVGHHTSAHWTRVIKLGELCFSLR